MGWPGEKQRHAASARGIKTTRPEVVDNKVVWFSSRGMIGEVVSLLNMVGFKDLFGGGSKEEKIVAKGYKETEYQKDANQLALLPAEAAAESVDWLKYEWNNSTPKRQAQLLMLAKKARFKINQELGEHNPAHTQSHLKESRRHYNDFIINVGGS